MRAAPAALLLCVGPPAWADLPQAREAYLRADFASALAEFERLARQGDAQAQRYLGVMYGRGQGVARDESQAYFWLTLAAARGDSDAPAARDAVRAGLSPTQRSEIEAAARAWRPQVPTPPSAQPQQATPAVAPHPDVAAAGASTMQGARAAYDSGDFAAALPTFRKLAEEGSAEAQTALGLMYENGQGVARDDAQAALWFGKAAEQGASLAQYNLGNLYREGRGVAKDAAQAASWYRAAAERGLVNGQFNLALTYLHGDGSPYNPAQAAYWFRKAAEQGDSAAQNDLGVLYRDGMGVPKDNGQAYFWFLLAASQGNSVAIGNRDAIAQRLSAAERERAQQSVRSWIGR
jgi:TPR repeat protein